MNKILILKAFEKARIEKKKSGNKKPSLTDLSEELSIFIIEIKNFSLGERSFRDYYNEAKKLENKDEDISIKQISVINGLLKYLGFNDYQEFLRSIENDRKKTLLQRAKSLIKKNKAILTIILVVLIGIIAYNYVTRERWMIWQEDHYTEVDFDINKYNVNQIKIFKEERIDFFKKITPNCENQFFDKDGSVRIWYGKNKKKELEYFTALGLHPETGKTLKPISQYMIKKYICANYDEH